MSICEGAHISGSNSVTSGVSRLGREAARAALDALYPRRCLSCGRWMPRGEDGFLCVECYESIEFIERPCPRCGCETGPHSRPGSSCPACRHAVLHFQGVYAGGTYSTPLKELVHALKYGRERSAALPLAQVLLAALRGTAAAEFAQVVVAVALHRSRLRSRTFNQSELIGRLVARGLGLPFARALRRTRPTPSQTELSASARRRNVKGAFEVSRPRAIAGRQVLLIDDVITSCATTSECSKALLAAGALRVYAAAPARWGM